MTFGDKLMGKGGPGSASYLLGCQGMPGGCHRVPGPAVLPSTREHLQPWGAVLSNASPFQPTAAPRGDVEQKLGWHGMGISWHGVAVWSRHGTARASSSVVVPHHVRTSPSPAHPLCAAPYIHTDVHPRCTPKETQTPRDIQSWQMPPRQGTDPRPCQDVATSHAIRSKNFQVFLPHFVVFPPVFGLFPHFWLLPRLNIFGRCWG